ncbi:MAG: hypothetical protein ABIQ88_19910 [Chitinophagaceae bacterium]
MEETPETPKPKAKPRSKAAKRKKKNSKKKESAAKRPRGPKRAFPIGTFEESYDFSKKVYEFGSGQRVRRLAIFDHIGKSPDSGPSRMLVINSGKYGLINGGYQSEFLELTKSGLIANQEETSNYDKHRVKLKIAIEDIAVFNFLYVRFNGNKLPNQSVIADIIKEEFKDVEEEDVNQVVDLFIVNAQYLGLLKVISGAERLVNFEHCLESFSKSSTKGSTTVQKIDGDNIKITDSVSATTITSSLENVCFYITPIGEEHSVERKHSDLFLGSIVEPALESLNLKVIRADQIDKPGTITKQIIEYLSKAKLVIADLSFSNPNVFYELAIRHAFRLPTVQIIRKGDKIPFDVSNSRTIPIDTTDIYTLIPKLETYKAEIASQVRQALSDPDSVDNPLTIVYPNIKLQI